jgi:hypothetical protein
MRFQRSAASDRRRRLHHTTQSHLLSQVVERDMFRKNIQARRLPLTSVALVQHRLKPTRGIVRQVTDGPPAKGARPDDFANACLQNIAAETRSRLIRNHARHLIDDGLPACAGNHEWVRPDKE